MKQKLFNVLLFAAGAAVGSLVTWKIVKTKYERIAQEEIDSVKETWARMEREDEVDSEDIDEDTEDNEDSGYDESDMIAYHTLVNMYSKPGTETENDKKGGGDDEVPYINGPYIITPEDFGDGDYDHDLYCLTYYSDGILSNDWYEEIDIDETIGDESLEHFGDYAEDIVHVRNERLKADYEVVRDDRTYAELVANDPLLHMYAN